MCCKLNSAERLSLCKIGCCVVIMNTFANSLYLYIFNFLGNKMHSAVQCAHIENAAMLLEKKNVSYI